MNGPQKVIYTLGPYCTEQTITFLLDLSDSRRDLVPGSPTNGRDGNSRASGWECCGPRLSLSLTGFRNTGMMRISRVEARWDQRNLLDRGSIMGPVSLRSIFGLIVVLAVAGSVLSQPNVDLVERMLKISKEKKTISPKSDDSPVRKLQIEQFNIALEELQLRCREFQTKIIRLEPVIDSCRKVFRSELALYDDPKDRIKLIEQVIDLVKWYEKELEKNLKEGLGNRGDYLKIRYDRLGLEAELLNEKEVKQKGEASPNPKKV